MQAAPLPDEGDRTPVIATPTHANDSPLDATLGTLMRMAGAGAATLLERRGDAGALRRLAGEPASSDRLDLIAETVCRTVDARANQPHWLADPAAP